MAEPSTEHPLYAKVREREDSRLWMITVDEGWRKSIVAEGMYEPVADWLLSLMDGKSFPGHGSVGTISLKPGFL